MTFDKDRSQVRVGSLPQVMAALRNTAIGLMRVVGETNIAAACRRFAAQPWPALFGELNDPVSSVGNLTG